MKLKTFLIILLPVLVGLMVFVNYENHKKNNQLTTSEVTSESKYQDVTYGFTFTLPTDWKYQTLQQDLNCCGKIIFFPNKSQVEMYNGLITKNDENSKNVLETISPIYINISKILGKNVTLPQLVKDNCGQPTQCDESSRKTMTIAGLEAAIIDTKPNFEGKKVFFIKNYTGTGISGPYLFTITMRSDTQTQKLFDITSIQREFNSVLTTFSFSF
jgi:hypothetical protein